MKKLSILTTCAIVMVAVTAQAQTTKESTTKSMLETAGEMMGIEKKKVEMGEQVPNFTLSDIHGHEWSLYDAMEKHDAEAVIIQFLSTKCPVSRGYDDRTASTFAELADDGVLYLGICSSHTGVETDKELREWAAKERMAFPVLLDQESHVADLFDARFTPEYYVLDADGVLKYHGALDNKKQEGESGRVNYLLDATESVLADKPVEKDYVAAFGCTIKRKS